MRRSIGALSTLQSVRTTVRSVPAATRVTIASAANRRVILAETTLHMPATAGA
jgi:hypothetical protein